MTTQSESLFFLMVAGLLLVVQCDPPNGVKCAHMGGSSCVCKVQNGEILDLSPLSQSNGTAR